MTNKLNNPTYRTVLYSTARLFGSIEIFFTSSKFSVTAFMNTVVFSIVVNVSVIWVSIRLSAEITVNRLLSSLATAPNT